MNAQLDRERGDRANAQARKELDEYRKLAKEASDETNRVAYEGALQSLKRDKTVNEEKALRAAAFRLVKPTVRPYPLDHDYLIKRLRQTITHFNPSDKQLEDCVDALVFDRQIEKCIVEDTIFNGVPDSEKSTTFYSRTYFPWDTFKKYNVKTVQLEARAMREEDEAVEKQRLADAEARLVREAEERRLAEERAIQEELERKQRAQERKDKLANRLQEKEAAEKKAAAEAAAQKKIDDLKASQELLALAGV
jgi:hypothetical protein